MPVQRPCNLLNGDVTGRILHIATSRHQHLPLARSDKIALKLFIDVHSADGHVRALVLRVQLHFKRTSGFIHHFSLLLSKRTGAIEDECADQDQYNFHHFLPSDETVSTISAMACFASGSGPSIQSWTISSYSR